MNLESSPSFSLIRSLLKPSVYPHPVPSLRLVETHISWVMLTGPYAYKIKKSVDLGFVDFSTLEKRRFYCYEELRLNRRLAPHLYLEVLPLTGTPEAPRWDGRGEPFEFAVKMKQFSQEALLSNLLEQGSLSSAHIDTLAEEVANFHSGIEAASAESPFGRPEAVWEPAAENFRHFAESDEAAPYAARIRTLEDWSRREFETLQSEFADRKQSGYVRECHGDMHLGNMIREETRDQTSEARGQKGRLAEGPRRARFDQAADTITIFDCIEFNESLRWIDVLSETVFCAMDLEDRGRKDFAYRFLNRYLEITGDYAGLTVAPFYRTYRALVRAKVACLRLGQEGLTDDDKQQLQDEFHGYLRLAERYIEPSPHPRLSQGEGTGVRGLLIITHGLSGSGKTSGTQPLVEELGAVRLRSDVERKRLHGLEAADRTGSGIESGLYAPEVTRATYDRLAELTVAVLRAGFPVIVDATFLKASQRDRFRDLAAQHDIPFFIVDFQASEQALKARIAQRRRKSWDASEATFEVLAYQRDTQDPLHADERPFVIPVATDDPEATDRLPDEVRSRCRR